jgi:hypothetical protein
VGGDRLLTAKGTPRVTTKKDSSASVWRNQEIGVPIKRLRQASGDYIRRQYDKHPLANGWLPLSLSTMPPHFFPDSTP